MVALWCLATKNRIVKRASSDKGHDAKNNTRHQWPGCGVAQLLRTQLQHLRARVSLTARRDQCVSLDALHSKPLLAPVLHLDVYAVSGFDVHKLLRSSRR